MLKNILKTLLYMNKLEYDKNENMKQPIKYYNIFGTIL